MVGYFTDSPLLALLESRWAPPTKISATHSCKQSLFILIELFVYNFSSRAINALPTAISIKRIRSAAHRPHWVYCAGYLFTDTLNKRTRRSLLIVPFQTFSVFCATNVVLEIGMLNCHFKVVGDLRESLRVERK